MQPTQRLVDAKGHNEWLIQQRMLWMVYANNTETGWCQRAQWMVDTTKDAVDGLYKQHRDWLMPKGHNEWLIQQRMLCMVYANNTETCWCKRAQWMVDTTKDAVHGLCKQHRDWLMPSWCQRTQLMDDNTKDTVDGLCKHHRDWWCQRTKWMVNKTKDTVDGL